MKKSELIRLLSSSEEKEVLLEDEDGWMHEIEIGHKEETFDGFDTVYPAVLTIKKHSNT